MVEAVAEKEEEKNVMSDKSNALFPSTTKIYAKASNIAPKTKIIIPNIDILAKALDKDITPKELQFFFMEAKIRNLVKVCIP